MLTEGVVVGAGLLWLGVLFAIAVYGERRPRAFEGSWPAIYALSLAVYCTSWTFFGTVTQAARYDWALPPTFVGTIALYVLGAGVLVRLVRQVRESNATSLADYIAARLGKDGWLAAVVTLVALVGIVPYIALQLKAVAMSFAMLVRTDALGVPAWQDSALYVALAMAAFAMLFGTRSASAAEHNRGLVLAMAFEALLKLGAMLALGWFVLRLPDAPSAAVPPMPEADAATDWSGFAPLVLLGVLAMFTLPHQFHVGAVECRDERHVLRARWLFPLYLLLIALPVLPLARAGEAWLGAGTVPSDLYVLALPLSQGQDGLALLAFLGGLSAGTGMVIVSTLALSLMIGNHLLAPLLLHGAWSSRGRDLRGAVLMQRRLGILAIVLLAWGYSRLIAGNDALADVGALSFSALATLAPAMGFALWRPQTSPRAVIAGIAVAALAWSWLLLVPVLVAAREGDAGWLVAGPWGWRWLAPDAFVGLTGWSRLGRAVGVSLFAGVVTTWLWAAWSQSSPRRSGHRGLDADTLREAGLRFLPRETVESALADAPAVGAVSPRSEATLEQALATVLGSASARLLLDAARREAGRDFDTVAAIVGEASQDLRFNQRVLEAALQNMSQGISVVDRDLRLVAWNRRYAELFGYPEGMLEVGRSVSELTAWALQRMPHAGTPQAALSRRLGWMRAGTPHLTERVFPDGSIVEIRGNPMPGGGFVATFTDVTAYRRTEAELVRSNETLEQRVGERTASLDAARRDAETANDAKSRFLAAIGHDLLQPLHAAHLFTDALAQQALDPGQRASVNQIRGALDSTTDLLTGLLDMSRLEAGGLVPESRDFPLAEVLDPLASEFGALAAERGLALRYRPTTAWVRTDPQLLRRILQNFLANAVRYTPRGGILLGVRRSRGDVRIEVHDTGVGIASGQQALIFEEFRRGEDANGQGLGLGLAIADRIARLLEAPLSLRSQPGIGTVFAVQVAGARPPEHVHGGGHAPVLAGLHVLAVDNESSAVDALAQVLRGWGCQVTCATSFQAAKAALDRQPADLWVLDYHLDAGDTGVDVHRRLATLHGARPALVLSADGGETVRRAVHESGLPLLLKPVKPLALKSVLDRLLAARTLASEDRPAR
ncbi:hybrid sensor histidine kinase/response regulator [Luteimonas vadosa]|uniref:histidine kinase n=1 Tax=Luteimonas vadosa TaxID=1165507 RepID=A0ABP9DZ32_9GAMM